MRKYFTILFLLVAVITVYAQQTITKSIIHDGLDREFIMYIPASYSGNSSVPLVFNFHGYTSTATEQMIYGDFRPIADTAGFIVVHPQGTLLNGVTHWNVGGWTVGSTVDDVGFTEAMIDSISAEYNIDLSRIYSTGMSNGGFMSFLLSCQLSDKIAAIASVTGSMTPEIYDFCNPTHPSPILQFHGTSDLVVPYNGEVWTRSIEDVIQYWVDYNNCNTVPVITNLPDIDPLDGSTVIHYAYEGGTDDIATEHFKIIGGGHTWPGSPVGGFGTNYDINASVEIWNFFLRYELNDGTTDIVNTQFEQAINIYPNPSSSVITIENNFGEKINFEIISISGTKVKEGLIRSSNHQVDLTGLHAGMYFIKVGNQVLKINKR